ncbi:hypothetical protein EON76_02935 [bacterium]|nr:MAG: hypothetical protein EON76_02935 [bacterium]
MTSLPLPHITHKQHEILILLYTYRFLTRVQLQKLLHHKDKRRIISWVKDLREKKYIDWHYDTTNYITKNQPAIYYLSLNAIRYLRTLNTYPNEELQKRYKESTRTAAFISHCLLIADCCISLQSKNDHNVHYDYSLPADYIQPDNTYHFLTELKPHLFFAKHQVDTTPTHYLLEHLLPTLPRYQLRKRIKDYIDFLSLWNESNGERPIALLVCPTVAELMYVKRRAKKVIEEEYAYDTLHIRVTTIDKIRDAGIASKIWEEIETSL